MELASGMADEIVRNFDELRLRVFGTSMAPSVLPGDLVLIQRADLEEIEVGEIAMFRHRGRLFVHRVVDRKVMPVDGSATETCLITRGDRQRDNDAPVFSSELLGRVISIERGNRNVHVMANRSNRLIARLLQFSDKVISVYLLLAACWELSPSGGTNVQCDGSGTDLQRGRGHWRPSDTAAL
jgi:signal peptidase I